MKIKACINTVQVGTASIARLRIENEWKELNGEETPSIHLPFGEKHYLYFDFFPFLIFFLSLSLSLDLGLCSNLKSIIIRQKAFFRRVEEAKMTTFNPINCDQTAEFADSRNQLHEHRPFECSLSWTRLPVTWNCNYQGSRDFIISIKTTTCNLSIVSVAVNGNGYL